MDIKKRRALFIIAVAVVAAIAAGVVLVMLTTSSNQTATQTTKQTGVAAATTVPMKQVVVAGTDIDANKVLTDSMLIIGSYPVDLVPGDTFTNTAELIGMTARTKVFGGQMLLKRQFVAGGGRVGSSVNVPKDKVLIAFPSTDILNSTGAVQPGDHVDILLSMPISGTARLDTGAQSGSQVQGFGPTLVAQTTLQNIEIYSTGVWNPPNSAPNNNPDNTSSLKIITFLVDPQEAVILKYIKDSGGIIDLVVRSLENKQINKTDPVNIDYLADLYRFLGVPKNK